MCHAQVSGIPAKLDIGYTNDGLYHAWISTYLKDKGWVDNIVEFNGDTWQLLDPTMTAASKHRSRKKTGGKKQSGLYGSVCALATQPCLHEKKGDSMKNLSNEELMSFCSQLSMILHAGISSIEGLAIMKEDLPDGEGKKILETLYEHMEMSGNLAQSMKETEVFPEYVCSMTEIGEQTGRLDEVMDGLALHYEREKDLAESIKSALLYPAVMLGMLTVVILILVIKVMPVFHEVLQQLGGGLTGVSAGF